MRPRFWLLLGVVWLAILVLVVAVSRADAQELRQEYVRVTFYTLDGRMASGGLVHRDAAACSRWMPMGTQVMFPDGYIVTCLDRGLGDWYWRGWIDVWAPSLEWGRDNITAAYGDFTWVTVTRWGWDE